MTKRGIFLAFAFAVFAAVSWFLATTKIYNVKSFNCLINGDWLGSSANRKDRELAQQGEVWAQYGLGFRLVNAGVCFPDSAENRREGLEWLQKAAENESSGTNVGTFHSFARLYREDFPSFLPVAENMVMNAGDFTEEKFFHWNRFIVGCDRGEKDWAQCRETAREGAEKGEYMGKWYYAEILARGLGGETDRGKAAEILNDLYASQGDGLGDTAAKLALTQRMRNLGLLNINQ